MDVGILGLGSVLMVMGLLGVTMFNTMSKAKDEKEVIAKNINITFMTWVVVGLLFVLMYGMVWVHKATREHCICQITDTSQSELCKLQEIGPNSMIMKTKAKISLNVFVYLGAAMLITTCSEGIALYTMIDEYKGTTDEQTVNRKRASDIYITFMFFMLAALAFVGGYSYYAFKLKKD